MQVARSSPARLRAGRRSGGSAGGGEESLPPSGESGLGQAAEQAEAATGRKEGKGFGAGQQAPRQQGQAAHPHHDL